MRIDLIRALLAGLGVKRKLQAAARFLLSQLPTEEMSCRKKQNRTEKRNQNPSRICLGNRRNARIPMTLVVVAPPIVDPIVIAVGIGQRGRIKEAASKAHTLRK
jgi:hypothetical protein